MIAGFATFYCLMFVPSDDLLQNYSSALSDLFDKCEYLRGHVSETEDQLKSVVKQQRALMKSNDCRRQSLLKRDWKALRSVPFEQFLKKFSWSLVTK